MTAAALRFAKSMNERQFTVDQGIKAVNSCTYTRLKKKADEKTRGGSSVCGVSTIDCETAKEMTDEEIRTTQDYGDERLRSLGLRRGARGLFEPLTGAPTPASEPDIAPRESTPPEARRGTEDLSEPVDYEKIFASRPIAFIVGSTRKQFQIHSGAISRLSEPLKALVQGHRSQEPELLGPLVDSNAEAIEFVGMEPEDFVRLCEFAYKGNYTFPVWGNPNDGFTPGFLSHARLYSFAGEYGINNLTALARTNLQCALTAFPLSSARVGPTLELVRYVYQNKLESGHAPLRKLVVEYVVRNIDVIGDSDHFSSLLTDGGEFVADFWKAVQKKTDVQSEKKSQAGSEKEPESRVEAEKECAVKIEKCVNE